MTNGTLAVINVITGLYRVPVMADVNRIFYVDRHDVVLVIYVNNEISNAQPSTLVVVRDTLGWMMTRYLSPVILT